MEEIELRLVANNVQAVKSVKELATESDKLYKNNEKNQKREKGLIADIEDEMTRLQKARRDAFRIEDIEKYNRKLAEAKQGLKEYEEAGLKVEKQSESMMKAIGKWALTIGGVTAAFKLLKDAFMETTQGIVLFNSVAAIAKQVMADLVSGAGLSIEKMRAAAVLARELHDLKMKDAIENYKAKILLKEFNELYTKGIDQTNTSIEKIKFLTEARKKHNEALDIEINSTREQIALVKRAHDLAPTNEKLLLRYAELMGKVADFESEKASGIRRIERQITGEMQQQIEEQLKALDKITGLGDKLSEAFINDNKKFWDDYDNWFMDMLDKQAAKLEKTKAGNMGIAAGFLELDPGKGYSMLNRALKGKKEVDMKSLQWNKTVAELNQRLVADAIKRSQEAEESDFEAKQQRIEAIKNTIYELGNLAREITNNAYEDARRNREILDTQIQDAQQSLDQEIRLYEAGYASNVTAKKKEVEELQKLRAKALENEEAAAKRQRTIDNITQLSSLVTASAQTFKAFPGPLLPLAIAIVGAMFAAFAVAKTRARESTKLASGGHGEVTGRLHSQGGEAFLNHVEVEQGERWGVLSRPASRRYGKVFGQMVDSFNRNQLVIPKSPGTVNNILLDTSMTNGRLERVENQLIKLNQYFEGQETISDNGRISVQKKGSTTRIIKHR